MVTANAGTVIEAGGFPVAIFCAANFVSKLDKNFVGKNPASSFVPMFVFVALVGVCSLLYGKYIIKKRHFRFWTYAYNPMLQFQLELFGWKPEYRGKQAVKIGQWYVTGSYFIFGLAVIFLVWHVYTLVMIRDFKRRLSERNAQVKPIAEARDDFKDNSPSPAPTLRSMPDAFGEPEVENREFDRQFRDRHAQANPESTVIHDGENESISRDPFSINSKSTAEESKVDLDLSELPRPSKALPLITYDSSNREFVALPSGSGAGPDWRTFATRTTTWFEDFAPEGGLLVGMEIGTAQAGGSIVGLIPIYQVGDVYEHGSALGDSTATWTRLLAGEGQVVTGIRFRQKLAIQLEYGELHADGSILPNTAQESKLVSKSTLIRLEKNSFDRPISALRVNVSNSFPAINAIEFVFPEFETE